MVLENIQYLFLVNEFWNPDVTAVSEMYNMTGYAAVNGDKHFDIYDRLNNHFVKYYTNNN